LSASAAQSQITPARPTRLHQHQYQCIGISGDNSRKCRRPGVWLIGGVGIMCNNCYDRYLSANWRVTRLEDIVRLSEDERDFWNG